MLLYMNNQIDFYKILNVNKYATSKEIKNSYHKLALKYHPDKNKDPDASEKFRKIRIAYEVLSDAQERLKYDSFDKLENNVELKQIFLCYYELITEICEKYNFNDNERRQILAIFNPNDFKQELDIGDIESANHKLFKRIMEYIPKFLLNRMSINFPYLTYALNFF